MSKRVERVCVNRWIFTLTRFVDFQVPASWLHVVRAVVCVFVRLLVSMFAVCVIVAKSIILRSAVAADLLITV